MTVRHITIPADKWHASRPRIDPVELLLSWASEFDAEGQLAAKRAVEAMRAPPPPRDAQGERDTLLRHLRLRRYADGSDRDAAKRMAAEASRLRDDRPAPLTQPGKSLHRIAALNGGSFPSAETVRKVIAGVIRNDVGRDRG